MGEIIFALFAAGLMMPPQVNMISLYNLMSDLGLKNKLTGLVVVASIPMVIMYIFFQKYFVEGMSIFV